MLFTATQHLQSHLASNGSYRSTAMTADVLEQFRILPVALLCHRWQLQCLAAGSRASICHVPSHQCHLQSASSTLMTGLQLQCLASWEAGPAHAMYEATTFIASQPAAQYLMG